MIRMPYIIHTKLKNTQVNFFQNMGSYIHSRKDHVYKLISFIKSECCKIAVSFFANLSDEKQRRR